MPSLNRTVNESANSELEHRNKRTLKTNDIEVTIHTVITLNTWKINAAYSGD